MTARLTSWLEFPSVVRGILGVEDVALLSMTRGGHNRKLIVASGSRRFVCHLSVHRRTLGHLDRLMRLLGSSHVDAQPILASGLRVRDFLAHGAFFLVLGYVPGEIAAGVRSHRELEAIAANLARLHAVSLESALALFPGSSAALTAPELAARAAPALEELRTLAAPGHELADSAARRWLDHLAGLPQEALRQALLHGDPHGGNVVLHDGSASWIDTEDFRLGLPSLELTECLLASYCGMDDARQRTFVTTYLEHATAGAVAVWEEWGALLASLALLERARRMFGHALRASGKGDLTVAAGWEAAARDHWHWFQRFATELPAAGNPWDALASVAPSNRPTPFFPVPY